jgi:hypothetical protein
VDGGHAMAVHRGLVAGRDGPAVATSETEVSS